MLTLLTYMACITSIPSSVLHYTLIKNSKSDVSSILAPPQLPKVQCHTTLFIDLS